MSHYSVTVAIDTTLQNLKEAKAVRAKAQANLAAARDKLAAYFAEQGWVLREDIPEDLVVAYGLMNSLASKLETPKVLEVIADTTTKFVEIHHD